MPKIAMLIKIIVAIFLTFLFSKSQAGDTLASIPVSKRLGYLHTANYRVLASDTAVKHGIYESYFNLKKIMSGNFFENTMHGSWRRFYKDGELMIEASYIRGRKHGKWLYYFHNGKTSCIAVFNQGKKVGTWQSFHQSGTLKGERIYSNDTLLDEKQYYENKILRREYHFSIDSNGIEIVKEYENFPSGKAKMFSEKHGGLLHGEQVHYHETGVLWYHFRYDMGRLMEVIDCRAPEGTIMSLGTFKNGDGELRTYHGDGSLFAIENYKDGVLRGKAEYFYKGILRAHGFYFNGNEVGTWKYYNKNKKLQLERNYYDGSGPYYEIEYHSSGAESLQGEVENDMREGVWKSYNFYGELEVESHYHKGLLHGEYRRYFSNSLEEVGGYFFGEKVGKWQSFNKNKKLTHEIAFVKDMVIDTSSNNIGLRQNRKIIEIRNPYFEPSEWLSSAFSYTNIDDTKYTNHSLIYPPKAKELDVTGKVQVIFLVDEFGLVQAPKILKGIGYGCDEAVIELYEKFPPYTPTFENGMPIVIASIKDIVFAP